MKFELEHMEQLVMDQLAGTISPENQQLLKNAIEEDETVAQLWNEYSTSLAIYQHGNKAWNKEAAWTKVHSAIENKNQTPVIPITKRNWVRTAAVAAACIIIVAGSIYLFTNKKEPLIANQPPSGMQLTLANGEKISIEKGKGAIQTNVAQFTADSNTLRYASKGNAKDTAMNTLSVPQGLDYAIALSDGSKVWVNAATQIRFPLNFPAQLRKLELDGEAYFEVAKDSKRPFIVHTRGMDIQVLGTSFNVKAYRNEAIQASLIEGRVEARTANNQLVLTPGKAAMVTNVGALKELSFSEDLVLAWRKGFYFFRNEPIASIDYTMQRWFGYHFEYADNDISKIHFSGALEKKESLQTFLKRIASSASLKYTIKDNTVLLQRQLEN